MNGLLSYILVMSIACSYLPGGVYQPKNIPRIEFRL